MEKYGKKISEIENKFADANVSNVFPKEYSILVKYHDELEHNTIIHGKLSHFLDQIKNDSFGKLSRLPKIKDSSLPNKADRSSKFKRSKVNPCSTIYH